MIGLVYENFLILKKQILMASILLILSLFLSLTYNEYIFFVLSTLLITMLPITACVYENDSKMIKVLLSMPIDRIIFVRGKYMTSFLMSLSGFIINITYLLLMGNNFLLSFVLSLMCFMIGTTSMNLMLPLVFKYGVEKAKFLMLCLMLGGSIIGAFLYQFKSFLTMPSIPIIITVIIIGYFLLYIISYLISCKIYKKIELI